MSSHPESGFPCPVAQVADLLGDVWIPRLLRDAMFGVRRYEDFHRLQGIGRSTLTDRLQKLVAAGILETHLYQDNPPRKEYLLTERGRELFGVVAIMKSWGERWLEGVEDLVEFRHEKCGQIVQARTVCSCCGEDLRLADIDFQLGPGFPAELAEREDLQVRFPGSRTAAAEQA